MPSAGSKETSFSSAVETNDSSKEAACAKQIWWAIRFFPNPYRTNRKATLVLIHPFKKNCKAIRALICRKACKAIPALTSP